jgi:hypothetical protein
MKKNYVTPQMEIYRIQMSNSLLETSDLTPQNWGGGGIGGSRGFEDDGMDFIMGGGDFNDLQNMLLP